MLHRKSLRSVSHDGWTTSSGVRLHGCVIRGSHLRHQASRAHQCEKTKWGTPAGAPHMAQPHAHTGRKEDSTWLLPHCPSPRITKSIRILTVEAAESRHPDSTLGGPVRIDAGCSGNQVSLEGDQARARHAVQPLLSWRSQCVPVLREAVEGGRQELRCQVFPMFTARMWETREEIGGRTG